MYADGDGFRSLKRSKYGDWIQLSRTHLSTPSVTMPRIKAITTGSISGFVDLLLNLQSLRLDEPNLLESWHNKLGWNLTLFGDETWLRLFPKRIFVETDPTTSFFVRDFTDVDTNVTRHIGNLTEDTYRWNAAVLHYLGLDHIGHVYGPRSKLVPGKLAEMATAIEQIIVGLAPMDRTLLLVTGDHGMSDLGGHGGATLQELTTATLAINPRLSSAYESSDIDQTDLCTSLALLTAAPLPNRSMGVLLWSLMTLIHDKDRLGALLINYHQLLQLSTPTDRVHRRQQFEQLHLGNQTTESDLKKLWLLLREMQSDLRSASSTFDLNSMQLGLSLIIISLLSQTLFYFYPVLLEPFCLFAIAAVALLITSFTFMDSFSLISDLKLAVLFSALAYFLFRVWNTDILSRMKWRRGKLELETTVLFVMGPGLQMLSMFGSSFVEEEHQLWYFVVTSWSMWYVAETVRSGGELWRAVGMAVIWRLLRGVNQTGDKWAQLPDLGDWLNEPNHRWFLLMWLLGSLTLLLAVIRHRNRGHYGDCLILGVYGTTNAVYRVLELFQRHWIHRDLPVLICYAAVLAHALFVCARDWRTNKKRHRRWLAESVLLLTAVLCRPHNIGVIAGWALVATTVVEPAVKEMSKFRATLLLHCIGMASFFHMGNSHSVTTIDVQTGYVGVSQYWPPLVALLICLHTWAGPLFWLSLTPRSYIPLLLSSLQLLAICLSSSLMRYHLFVWSVFTPRLLYAVFHMLFLVPLLSLGPLPISSAP